MGKIPDPEAPGSGPAAASRSRTGLPWLAGAATSLLILSVVAASGYLLYSQSYWEQKRSQRNTLLHTATAAAALVDVDLHGTFASPDQETTSAYMGAIAHLERLRASNPAIKYVYTCIQRGDSVFFVLDPTPAGDRDGDGVDDKSHILQPYPDAGPSCRIALRNGFPAVDEEPYRDAWGTFISAYAPFFDSAGRQQGVVGVDMEISRFQGELQGMRRAAGYGLVIAFILSLGAGIGVGFFTRFRQRVAAELRRSMDRLAEEKARAEEATRAKAEFLATMSHEIRTPLNAVLGMLELLLDHPLDGAQGRRARIAHSSAEHLLRLLNDILDYSKMEAGRLRLESIPFDPAGECREVLTLLRAQAEEKGLRLDFRPFPRIPAAVLGDPARFRQVLMNLVGNALKFTPEGGIEVELEWIPGTEFQGLLELRVTDTGIGIPEDKLPLLFQTFSQADASTTRKYGGTGLGLAICKRIADTMGGTIGAGSRPGKGSTFVFSAPFMPADAAASAAAAASPAAAPAPAGASFTGAEARDDKAGFAAPSLPVLLVEDNAVNLLVARQLLEALGCRVETAGNGREAVERVAGVAFAAVLMDCRMPEMDGYQAARAIRALPGKHGRVPIIALTANAEEAEQRLCREAGMDDFLSKPVGRRALSKVLAHWTGRHDGRGEAGGLPEPPALMEEVLLGLPPAFLAELIDLFLAAAPESLAALEAAIEGGDAPRAARAAHTLRGAGAQMGADRFAGLCGEMEYAAETGGNWRGSLPEIRREFSKVGRELRKLRPEGT